VGGEKKTVKLDLLMSMAGYTWTLWVRGGKEKKEGERPPTRGAKTRRDRTKPDRQLKKGAGKGDAQGVAIFALKSQGQQ